MSLYEGAVKKPIMTSLCFLAVVIFGLFSLSKLPIDLYPDIDTNTIMVMTAYPGASASDIENNVTRPLENTLNAVSNLKHITSRSSENMSLITLEFEFGNDIDVLTNDVRDKLDMVSSQLPDDVENPIIFKFSTDMIPIVLLSVQAKESQSALYKILDDRVVNPLARIPGVGTVSISGAPQREIQVYCDPNKLEAYNLSIETISSIIGAENKNIPGGNFDIGNETYSLRVEGEFDDSRELADVGVGTAVLTRRLYQDGYAIAGLDFSPRMLEIARERMPRAALLCHDLTDGFPAAWTERRFDCIISTYALHHLTDGQKADFLAQCLLHAPLVLIGDVAFPDSAAQEACRRLAGEEWDEDEHYFVMDRLAFPADAAVVFASCSHCAGVIELTRK